MALNKAQKERMAKFIPKFKEYLKTSDREADMNERKERMELFGRLLSPHGIESMTEIEFGQVISSLWASQMWGNKGYLVEQLIHENGLDQLKKSLQNLLWGPQTIIERYDQFRDQIKGFGPGMITEILAFVHPTECGLLNKKAQEALRLIGFENNLPFLRKYQISGKDYEDFNNLLEEIKNELIGQGILDIDYLGIDYFLFEIWKEGGEFFDETIGQDVPSLKPKLSDFNHDEIIDQIIAIGQWLGFEVHREKNVSVGSKVDAVWQAKIANLGVVTYVFEVQRRGSSDSLIVNLQKTQNNPSVQRLVIVALQDDLEKLKKEISAMPENFRRMVSYMNVADVMRAYDMLNELSEIISNLQLVKSEFGE